MTLSATAGLLGFIAVALGAFGAHGLDARLSEEAKDWWATGTLYLLVHAALAAALGLQDKVPDGSGWLMVAGGAVFAGTLYAMALGAPRVLGAVTPIGGALMLAGWGWLAWSALRA